MSSIFNFDIIGHFFNFVLYSNDKNNNLYKYKYYDTTEEKIKDCEIFSPFSLFKCYGLTFQNTKNKKEFVQISLFDNYRKIEYIFFHDINDGSKIANAIFRDRNSVFVKDRKTNKWYGTNADVFLEATNYAITRKSNFNAADVFWDYYVVSEDEYKNYQIIKNI